MNWYKKANMEEDHLYLVENKYMRRVQNLLDKNSALSNQSYKNDILYKLPDAISDLNRHMEGVKRMESEKAYQLVRAYNDLMILAQRAMTEVKGDDNELV